MLNWLEFWRENAYKMEIAWRKTSRNRQFLYICCQSKHPPDIFKGVSLYKVDFYKARQVKIGSNKNISRAHIGLRHI